MEGIGYIDPGGCKEDTLLVTLDVIPNIYSLNKDLSCVEQAKKIKTILKLKGIRVVYICINGIGLALADALLGKKFDERYSDYIKLEDNIACLMIPFTMHTDEVTRYLGGQM